MELIGAYGPHARVPYATQRTLRDAGSPSPGEFGKNLIILSCVMKEKLAEFTLDV
jgi:hypothetical protein